MLYSPEQVQDLFSIPAVGRDLAEENSSTNESPSKSPRNRDNSVSSIVSLMDESPEHIMFGEHLKERSHSLVGWTICAYCLKT